MGDAAAERPRRRRWRGWVTGLVLAAAAWVAFAPKHAEGPTVRDIIATHERVNRRAHPDASPGRTVIDYAHLQETKGGLFHGTLSDVDGHPRATWTFDGASRSHTVEIPLSRQRFDELVAGFDRLSRFRATDPEAVADLQRVHVIALVTDAGTPRARLTVYLVPHPPDSPEAARWLELLELPRVP